MEGMAIWITGLPGSGKSTLADAVRERCPGFTVLRMDEFRRVVTPDPTYSEPERETAYRALVFTAGKLAELGHDVIIDATGNLRRWRDLARQLIPSFAEVYLQCPIELCVQRERKRIDAHGAPGGIYASGEAGWPVPGMRAPYEEPLSPEITLRTGETRVEDAARIIGDFIAERKKAGTGPGRA